jgi:hypothetical protein
MACRRTHPSIRGPWMARSGRTPGGLEWGLFAYVKDIYFVLEPWHWEEESRLRPDRPSIDAR